MNDEAQAELNRILDLGPDSINESERAFLQARRSYLTEEQRINFGITDKAPAVEDEVVEVKPSKKTK